MITKIKLYISENLLMSIFIVGILVYSLQPYATRAEGIASWYGGGEKLNECTANGEIFNPVTLTCASWDFPFNTKLKVTNSANGKSVIVRVNDRGPNKKLGRAIDLTKHAFSHIADIKKGLVTVKIEKMR